MRKNHYSNTISSQRWYDHFSSLLNTGNDLNGDFEVYVNETVTAQDADCLQCEENQPDILNHNIQLNEVESVLADLSNNKSPGLGRIHLRIYKTCTKPYYFCNLLTI